MKLETSMKVNIENQLGFLHVQYFDILGIMRHIKDAINWMAFD